MPTYIDFVTFRKETNPCISLLLKHLKHGAFGESQIRSMDYPDNKDVPVMQDNLARHLNTTPSGAVRLLFVENINTNLISILGEALDIDPIFFADHINTNFEDIEKAPPPPSLAILPTIIYQRGYLHLHYQQVVDLGDANDFINVKYNLKSDSNAARNIRRLAPLSGRQLALARGCCSLMIKKIKDFHICLILLDPPIRIASGEIKGDDSKLHQPRVLHGGFEGFGPPQSFSSFASSPNPKGWNKQSMLDSLLHYFQVQPPGFQKASPTILSLGFYAVRIILCEWNLYIQLTSRYYKHYEYSLRDIRTRPHDEEIVDLQRWRRRSTQSEHKLTLLAEFIENWMHFEEDEEPWKLILKDISYIRKRLQLYSESLQQTVTTATSMVQILDSQRSILEAISVKRLTFIAMIFIPLSWVASIFSMSDEYSPGNQNFWVYFATAIPLSVLVLILSILPYERLQAFIKPLYGKVRGELNRFMPSV